MFGVIPHNRPQISAEDRAAVDAVLASGWIAQGAVVASLESAFAQAFEGGAACAVSSGSAALFLALKALKVQTGAAVAVPSYACSALLNAVFLAGAVPRVVDVLPYTFCVDPDAVRTQAPDAQYVLAVHVYGAGADILALRKHDRVVIEDCCQSLGGAVLGIPLGAAGDAAVFSFYATKIVTSGQGGMIWSRSDSVVAMARDYRQFDGRETYEPRFNLQMTDMQAALALSQMRRIQAIRSHRSEIARAYLSALPGGLTVQAGLSENGRMVHRFVVVSPTRGVREALRTHMKEAGVECAVPVERFELLHRYMRLDPSEYPIAERLADTTLSLPMHLGLSASDINVVCEALMRFGS
jgi:perosamine synthetase